MGGERAVEKKKDTKGTKKITWKKKGNRQKKGHIHLGKGKERGATKGAGNGGKEKIK